MASPITAARLASLHARFGEPGTYTPAGGAGTIVSAIVDEGAHEIVDAQGSLIEALDLITFRRVDLDAPDESSRWTNGTDTWVVGKLVRRDRDEVTMEARLV